MASRSIPPLLEPYLAAAAAPNAAGSLVLLTSVLGTSANWLVLRYIQALLRPSGGAGTGIGFGAAASNPAARKEEEEEEEEEGEEGEEGEDGEEDEAAVLLVSFLRDLAFWREGLARLGVDLEAAARRGRFAFVDGLCGGLFGGSSPSPSPALGQGQGPGRPAWRRPLASPEPGALSKAVLDAAEQLRNGQAREGRAGQAEAADRSSEKRRTRRRSARGKRVVLIVDGLDLVLAASTPRPHAAAGEGPLAVAMKDALMDLREATHAVILTLASDSPLIHAQETPLERQHAWFALSLTHDADLLLSLRPLDTGAARDVSGVIRITARPTTAGIRATAAAHGDSHEWLYYVGGDGGVKVFERGQ
ncbi:hypothetical protein VTJ83DRAFT_1607 [Remersonia thermophila]|uniref:Elongator complex protein 6 n=1 Tax=Remersonia thermophila TaxID=72144 RepID=A0ABR4DGD8_9PEZI